MIQSQENCLYNNHRFTYEDGEGIWLQFLYRNVNRDAKKSLL